MSEHIELLTKVANLSMMTFMVSNMLGFGMRLSPAGIINHTPIFINLQAGPDQHRPGPDLQLRNHRH